MKHVSFAFAIALSGLFGACSPPPSQCIPGESRACTGPGGCSGGQVCLPNGTFGVCDCGSNRDGGADGAVDAMDVLDVLDVISDVGADVAADTSDAGPDVLGDDTTDVPADSGPSSCDPTDQSGCSSTQRCTWAHSGDAANVPTCQPNGTIALGMPCTTDSEFDACVRGTVCDGQVCAATCNPSSATSGCDAVHACVAFSTGASTAIALCLPGCDPVTQVRSTDGAAACGSTDPLMPNRACVGSPGHEFQCVGLAPGASTRTSDVVVAPPVYLNSCAPGFLPLLVAGTGSTDVICVAMCRPTPTSLESHPSPGGAAGSGYTCADRGTGPTHECRYFWWLETPPYSAYANTVGFCQDYTRYQWDSNADGTPDSPLPSCTTVSSTAHTYDATLTDAQYFGCVPTP